ncbi:MAG: head GIN domain-containing protein [Anaeromyxobacter sp.]
MRHAAVLLALASFACATPAHAGGFHWSPGAVTGDGKKVTQQRELPPFRALRMEGSLDVEVKVGPAQSVAVVIDGNLQPGIETRVERDTLVVSTLHDMNYQGEGKVRVTVPELRGVALSGSGDAQLEGTKGGDFNVSISGSGDVRWSGQAAALGVDVNGSGDVELSGSADLLQIAISGSGGVDADQLTAHDAKVSVAGSGDVELRLGGGWLDAAVSGSGEVQWDGPGQVRSASVAGSGEITHR